MSGQSTTLRIEIGGEFNIFSAAAVRQQLLDALDHDGEIEVDLSTVSEMDSAGMQLIVAAQREAARRNKPLHFINPSRAVRDVLELYDIDGHSGELLFIDADAQ